MTVTEKAAHLKGLMEGMNYDTNTNEGKLFKAIADLLDDLALTVSDVENEVAVLNDYIEEIDEDLGELEETVYDCCDDDCDCGCCDDDCCVDLECPACKESICFDSEELDELETVECPNCGKTLNVVKEYDIEEDQD